LIIAIVGYLKVIDPCRSIFSLREIKGEEAISRSCGVSVVQPRITIDRSINIYFRSSDRVWCGVSRAIRQKTDEAKWLVDLCCAYFVSVFIHN